MAIKNPFSGLFSKGKNNSGAKKINTSISSMSTEELCNTIIDKLQEALKIISDGDIRNDKEAYDIIESLSDYIATLKVHHAKIEEESRKDLSNAILADKKSIIIQINLLYGIIKTQLFNLTTHGIKKEDVSQFIDSINSNLQTLKELKQRTKKVFSGTSKK